MPKLAYSERRRRAEWVEASDREVLAGIARGEELALDELIRRKTRPLEQLAYRVLGDLEECRDVVQMTFLKVWQNRHRFDDKFSPNTWIYRITTNLAIDHLRSRRSRERAAEPILVHLRQIADSRHERDLANLRQQEVLGIFQELASLLTDKQRMIFVLREIEGLSSGEVAQIVGCRESTVRNHLFNSRKVLRDELLRRYPEYSGGHGLGEVPGERPDEAERP